MQRILVLALATATLSLFTASPSRAQDASPFMGGVAGGAFSDQASLLFGGRAGVPIAGRFFVIGEVGRALDVLPAAIQSELAVVSRLIELQTGARASIEASVPVFYGWGGVRWTTRLGRVAPFAEGGLGFARLTLDLDAVVAGVDLADDLRRDLADDNLAARELLAIGGGGITMPLRSEWSVDIGYRYNRLFTDSPEIGVNTVYTAVVYRF